MPRSPRIYLEKAVYYVTSRGDGNQHIYKDEEDFKTFLELLKKYKGLYVFKLFAFCLLPEHFHLLLELPEQKDGKNKMGTLSNIMHDLNSSYTKYFNAKYARKGHLFRERYKAALVEKESHLLRLSVYLHLNSQRLGLVSHPQQYPYSSYGAYVNEGASYEAVIKNERKEILDLLGTENYTEFTERVVKEPDFLNLHDNLQKGIVGSEDFQEKARQAFASYTKEKSSVQPNYWKKWGIVSLIVIAASIGLLYALKYNLEQKKENISLSYPYKLPLEVKELLRDMENTEWLIRIVSLAKGQVQDDAIHFEEGKFISRNFSAKNYPATEYFLIIEDDHKIIWESRQVGLEGSASWRGEIKKGEMEGGLRLRYTDGSTQDFSFVSVSSKKRK